MPDQDPKVDAIVKPLPLLAISLGTLVLAIYAGAGNALPQVSVMIVSGAIGGLVNYFYSGMPNNQVKEKDLTSCIVIGIGASLLMPFLFSLASSNPLSKATSDNHIGYLTLVSWCLLAGISGEPLITAMLKKLIPPPEGGADQKILPGGNENGQLAAQQPVAANEPQDRK